MASDALKFLAAFLRSPTKVGAIAPSSQYLARRMVHGLSIAHDETVVEFGPGTGPFTAALAQIIPSPDCYLGVERDGEFHRILCQRFPKLRVVNGSAEQAPRYVEQAGRSRVKAVVCGLPFASLPPSVQDAVIDALVTMLPPGGGGQFRTFQYVHAYPLPTAVRFRRRMQKIFGPCRRSRPIVRNLPPAFVLTWSR